MKKIVLPLLAVLALVTATAAQDAPPKPDFDNAPVLDVLLWARRDIGCGFMYQAELLLDPATGKPRTVSAEGVKPRGNADKTLLLFELLRRSGLVAFEVGGLAGPTYQLHDAAGAARVATLFEHPDEVGTHLFAGLSIRLRRVSAAEVAERIRERLTPGVGAVEVFETTHTVIVTDFADRLRAAWDIAAAADETHERAEDLIAADRGLRHVSAQRAMASLERLREKGETWKVTAHETANVLLFSGRRDEIGRVLERVSMLDRHEERPAYAESTRTIKLMFVDAPAATRTLREMFAGEVASGAVQIGSHVDRQVVFRGTAHDYGRAVEIMKALDVPKREGED